MNYTVSALCYFMIRILFRGNYHFHKCLYYINIEFEKFQNHKRFYFRIIRSTVFNYWHCIAAKSQWFWIAIFTPQPGQTEKDKTAGPTHIVRHAMWRDNPHSTSHNVTWRHTAWRDITWYDMTRDIFTLKFQRGVAKYSRMLSWFSMSSISFLSAVWKH